MQLLQQYFPIIDSDDHVIEGGGSGMAFEGALDSVATALGISSVEAGYLLGLVLIFMFMTVMFLLTRNGYISTMAGLGLGVIVARLLAWFPDWPIVIVGLVLAVIAIESFGGD